MIIIYFIRDGYNFPILMILLMKLYIIIIISMPMNVCCQLSNCNLKVIYVGCIAIKPFNLATIENPIAVKYFGIWKSCNLFI